MPLVHVFVPSVAGTEILVEHVAEVVAAALALAAGDVIAVAIPTGAVAVNGTESEATGCWPLVSVHGRDRGSVAQSLALESATDAVTDWATSAGLTVLGVSTEWILPETPGV